MNFGIYGKGIVGEYFGDYLSELGHNVFYRDPAKKISDSFDNVCAVFVCIPVSIADYPQLEVLKRIGESHFETPVFLRSTVTFCTQSGLELICGSGNFY